MLTLHLPLAASAVLDERRTGYSKSSLGSAVKNGLGVGGSSKNPLCLLTPNESLVDYCCSIKLLDLDL
jgi:hypothetical protein